MGHSCVLIVTDKLDAHADRVIDQLHFLDYQAFRVNAADLMKDYEFSFFEDEVGTSITLGDSRHRHLQLPVGVVAAYYRKPDDVVAPDDVTDQRAIEFVRVEGNALLKCLYAYPGIRWVNDPFLIARAEAKLPQLATARACGLEIPRTIVTNKVDRAKAFAASCRGGVICKTFAPTTIKIDDTAHGCYTYKLADSEFIEFLDSIRDGPTLLQEWIPKRVELRVTVIGNDIFACEIDSQSSPQALIDWRKADVFALPHKVVTLPTTTMESVMRFVRFYGLEFAALDFILTPDDKLVFLENNPNGQWYWIEAMTGLPMARAVAKLLVRA